jgi:hypothetical protein
MHPSDPIHPYADEMLQRSTDSPGLDITTENLKSEWNEMRPNKVSPAIHIQFLNNAPTQHPVLQFSNSNNGKLFLLHKRRRLLRDGFTI